MIKLIITDLDGTFLNSNGDYDRELFMEVSALMAEKGVHFSACTGKQCDRVEELFGDFRKLTLNMSSSPVLQKGL